MTKPSEARRRLYEKPVLIQVELVPEEAVLQSCKSGNDLACGRAGGGSPGKYPAPSPLEPTCAVGPGWSPGS